jgi:hypothetical protein
MRLRTTSSTIENILDKFQIWNLKKMEVEENYWIVIRESVGRKKNISVGNEGGLIVPYFSRLGEWMMFPIALYNT